MRPSTKHKSDHATSFSKTFWWSPLFSSFYFRNVYVCMPSCVFRYMCVCDSACMCARERVHVEVSEQPWVSCRNVILFLWVGISQWFEAYHLCWRESASRLEGFSGLSILSARIISMYHHTRHFKTWVLRISFWSLCGQGKHFTDRTMGSWANNPEYRHLLNSNDHFQMRSQSRVQIS